MPATSPPPPPLPPQPAPGPLDGGVASALRRFSAGLRAIIVMLVAQELATQDVRAWAIWLLLPYAMWAGALLLAEARGRPIARPALHLWLDVAWSVTMMHGAAQAVDMLALTLILPVVMASVLNGARHGVLLACFAALGLASASPGSANPLVLLGSGRLHLLPVLGVLALAPAAALLSRPMHGLRRRAALENRFEAEIDPRRGLGAVGLTIADRLRQETGADAVALVLASADNAPAVVSSSAEGGFRTSAAIQQHFEEQLARLPAGLPVSLAPRQLFGLLGGITVHGGRDDPATADAATQLAAMLEARRLIVVPLRLRERPLGHLLVAGVADRRDDWGALALALLGPSLARLIERAALVDALNEEIGAHARVRIGRDLHDSAIQPYLGIRYAIEALALRTPEDNPLRGDILALLDLMNHEVGELREVISVLRSGQQKGDNALVPAIRRQARRFSVLFGIAIHLDCPADITTSRAMAGAIFHMFNEALNNVRKHTTAKNVWIQLWAAEASIHLTVRDDAGRQRGQAASEFTPKSLTERVKELGGALSISRRDGLDTELAITIPI